MLKVSPRMAVPTTVKMPEPMTAPIPSEVSATGPSVFLRRVSGFSESEISLSMDFLAKSWDARTVLLRESPVASAWHWLLATYHWLLL